jgi:3-phytase
VIIGTNKKGDGGLIVYDVAGSVLQQTGGAPMNNVDLRQDVTIGGSAVTLVVASTVGGRTLELFSYDDEERQLDRLDVGPVETGIRSAGVCLYRNAEGAVDVFATRGNGLVQQWRLVESPTDPIAPRKQRELKFASHIEGCVVDDIGGRLFLSEETRGIWEVAADAASGDDRALIDSTGPDGHLAADVEGLTIARYPDGPVLLIASSQGDDRFAVYRLDPDPAYVASFTVQGPDGDDVSHTDGLDVTLGPLAAEPFDRGVLVVQDDDNETPDGEQLNQNFKLVPWRFVENAIGVE